MIVILEVWGPFKCQVCKKQRKNWEGRCYWDKETEKRTDFWCAPCFQAHQCPQEPVSARPVVEAD